MKKVSFIVPIYNIEEHYLRRCIESLINQTYSNIEIILVDDESPGICPKICDEYKSRDSRITVIHQKNKGLAGARNSGFFAATGDWISFVDGDDWLSNNCIENIFNTDCIDLNADVIMFGTIRESTKSYKFKYKYKNNKVFDKNECRKLEEDILDFNCNISTAYAKLIKRRFLLDNEIMHKEFLRQGAEGIEFNIRLFDKASKAQFLNQYYYHYLYVPTSISQSHNEKNHKMVINCFKEIKRYIIEKNETNKHNMLEKLNERLLYVIVTTAISGYFNKENKEKYKIKKEKFQEYLGEDIIKDALYSKQVKKMDIKRKIILFCIKLRLFFPLPIISLIRNKTK